MNGEPSTTGHSRDDRDPSAAVFGLLGRPPAPPATAEKAPRAAGEKKPEKPIKTPATKEAGDAKTASNASKNAVSSIKEPDKIDKKEQKAQTSPGARRRSEAHRGTVVSALFGLGMVLASLLFVAGSRLADRVVPLAPEGQQPALAVQAAPQGEGMLSVPEIIAAAAPSVVSVDLYDEDNLSAGGSASGVILSADGYIGTNAHVIEGFPLVRVVLHDGTGHTARVVGTDAASDLAVLKINATGLTPATFGDPADLVLGHQVVAIGNAAGVLPGTPSVGILSGVHRQVNVATGTGDAVLLDLLQTDAAINPGNSGGALVNSWGQVVGICVAKLEDSSVENIGFAIPATGAVPVLQSLIRQEETTGRAKLGASVLAVNETTGPPAGLPEKGLYIAELTPESALGALGVRVGDVIVAADGTELATTGDLLGILAQHAGGDEVELRVYRAATGRVETFMVPLYTPGAD